MKRRLLLLILTALIFFNSFPMMISAADTINSKYELRGTLYYNHSSPNTSVNGNETYAYKCYIYKANQNIFQVLFTKNGVIVRDEAINSALLKMVIPKYLKNEFPVTDAINIAKAFVEISGDVKFTNMVKDITSAASKSLGKLGAVYLGGGSVTVDVIAKTVATQTVNKLISHFTDISKIISESQLTYFYYVTSQLKANIKKLEAITDFTSYKNCEAYVECLSEIERLNDCAAKLTSAVAASFKDSTNFFKVLKNCLEDATSGFVGEFGTYINSYAKVAELKANSPDFVAKAIVFARDLKYCNGEISKIQSVTSKVDKTLKNAFAIVVAYDAYESAITIHYTLEKLQSVAFAEHPLPEEEDNDDTPAPSFDITEKEFAAAITKLKNKYPHGKYWNNYNGKVASGALKGSSLASDKTCKCKSSCPVDCSCSCGTLKINGSTVAWQCHGYALMLAYEVFGSNVNAGSDWSKITSLKNYNFKAGDVVRVNGNHTIFITKMDGDTVHYTDCNYTGPCRINWNGTYTVSKLRTVATYVRHYKGNTLLGTQYTTKNNTLSINYNANGGSVADSVKVGDIYQITVAEGINVRASAGTDSEKLGALAKGATIAVTETKASGNYTWGKISYKGNDGWIALDDDWVTVVGEEWNPKYYVSASEIFTKSTSKRFTQKCSHGEKVENGLYNASTFALHRDGYEFEGWSFSPDGSNVINENTAFYPEDLVKELDNGDKVVTVYAVWKAQSVPTPDDENNIEENNGDDNSNIIPPENENEPTEDDNNTSENEPSLLEALLGINFTSITTPIKAVFEKYGIVILLGIIFILLILLIKRKK